nr:hypothetical protein [uncultured Pseudodesulfovibrio sp.]
MRQVILMIFKGTRRLPTVRELESKGIQVSSAVARGRPIKIDSSHHTDGMATTCCTKNHLQKDKTDESKI